MGFCYSIHQRKLGISFQELLLKYDLVSALTDVVLRSVKTLLKHFWDTDETLMRHWWDNAETQLSHGWILTSHCLVVSESPSD